MLSLQHHPKVLITMTGLQNPTISPQALTKSKSLRPTTASSSRSISNLTSKGIPTINNTCFIGGKDTSVSPRLTE